MGRLSFALFSFFFRRNQLTASFAIDSSKPPRGRGGISVRRNEARAIRRALVRRPLREQPRLPLVRREDPREDADRATAPANSAMSFDGLRQANSCILK